MICSSPRGDEAKSIMYLNNNHPLRILFKELIHEIAPKLNSSEMETSPLVVAFSIEVSAGDNPKNPSHDDDEKEILIIFFFHRPLRIRNLCGGKFSLLLVSIS